MIGFFLSWPQGKKVLQFRGRFGEQQLMLNSGFRCDQIYKCQIYDFGHTLLCYLSQTYMFNKHMLEIGLLNKSSCLAPALGVTKFEATIAMNLITLCSAP